MDPDRIAVPPEGGTCDPADHLKGPRLRQFLNLVDEVVPTSPPLASGLKACHLVARKDEKLFNSRLLSANMAVLVPVEFAPKDADGNILKGGYFV